LDAADDLAAMERAYDGEDFYDSDFYEEDEEDEDEDGGHEDAAMESGLFADA